MDTAQHAPAAVTVEITLNKADHLPDAQRLTLMESFRKNLEILLGGPEQMRRTFLDQYVQSAGSEAVVEGEPQGALRQAFATAEYVTWMGVSRPLGAHFGILFERATIN